MRRAVQVGHTHGVDARGGLRRAVRWSRGFLHEVRDDRLLGLAAETAFFAVLSVFPGLLVAGSLLGLLDALVGGQVAEQARDRVLDLLALVLTDEASGVLTSVRSLFDTSRGGLLTFATVGALVSLSGAFAVACNALNLAHDTQEHRPWLVRRAVGLAMAVGTLVLGVLALGALVVGPLFGRGEQLAELVGLGAAFAFVWDVLRLPATALVLLLWATALLRLAPSRRLGWRDALPGAVLATLLWGLATVGFRLYLAVAAEGNPVLGAFGGGAIVMTWTYLLSLALLLGGELNAVLQQARAQRDAEEQPEEQVEGQQLALFPVEHAGRAEQHR